MIRHFVGDPWSVIYGFYCRTRRRHLVSGENISSIAVALKLSRTTVRKHLTATEEPVYQRKTQSLPKLGGFQDHLRHWLDVDSRLPRKQRRAAQRLFECLQAEGYRGAYDSVQRFVRLWKLERETTPASTKAFIPLVFPPGETCQFDWSEEVVELGGLAKKIKVGHFRLCYSRKMFVVGYPCETQEMVLDAHNRAFVFFGGVPLRMVSATAPALPYLLHPCSRTTTRKPLLTQFLWVRNASLTAGPWPWPTIICLSRLGERPS